LNTLNEIWGNLSRQSRIMIVLGVVAILGLMTAVAIWAYRPDYQILFSDLAPRDASAMTAELDKLKTPYQLGGSGNTILVPKDLVYKTRLKLMGKDIPLHGAVGFEVFNNADFGMTEFVQKVNYLRAIQGELTRTILAIEDIQAARVHLAIPEQGLFKKAVSKPKASVTLTMKPGQTLAAEQILGIQRLVAASVPDIVSNDVTLLDQHGIALTRIMNGDGTAEMASTQLDAKRNTEDYLIKKVSQVLDRTFGPGEAIASVDVALNMDQSKVTTEEVIPARSLTPDSQATGVVVRERHTVRDTAAATDPNSNGKISTGGGNSSDEADYQVGRRTEQLAVASGSVKRMTVAVVVKASMTEAQIVELKEVVALAVGFNQVRGDAIVVQSMNRLITPLSRTKDASEELDTHEETARMDARARLSDQSKIKPDHASNNFSIMWTLSALLLFAVGICFLILRANSPKKPRQLSDLEREKLLIKIKQWVEGNQDLGYNKGQNQ
jgi:flagellar M-ring protein FliF